MDKFGSLSTSGDDKKGMRRLQPVTLGGLAAALTLYPTVTLMADSFEYDELGRLTKATYDNGTEITYTYDPAGNRKTMYVEVPTPPNVVDDTYLVIDGYYRDLTPLDNDSDVNGDTLSITSVGSPTVATRGTTALHSSTVVRYTPTGTNNPSDTDSFSYVVSDGTSQPSVTGTVNITFEANAAPTANNVTRNKVKHGSLERITLSDAGVADGNAWQDHIFENLSTPANGTATLAENDTVIEYVSDVPLTGSDTFTFDVNDQHGGTVTGKQVTMNVVEPDAIVVNYTGSGYSVTPIWPP